MLQQDEIARIEDLLDELHNIFPRQRFDQGMNEEIKVKLTPNNDSLFYN